MKYLVTGCMGFIGSNLCGTLLKKGHQVIGVDNLSNSSNDPTGRMKRKAGLNWSNFQFFDYDVRDRDKIANLIVQAPPQAIIHLAAMGSVQRSFLEPKKYIENNEIGFLSMAEVAEMCEVKHFVFASSSSVYGTNPNAIKSEHQTGLPLSPYAATKLMNEYHAMMWRQRSKLKSIIGLRFFNVYGPGQNHDSEYSAVIPKFMNSDKIMLFGGKQIRDFTFVDDVSFACELAANSPVSFDIYNVGGGQGTSIEKLAEMIPGKKEITRLPQRPGEAQNSIADTKKAEKNLGFKAQIDLKTGLQIMGEI